MWTPLTTHSSPPAPTAHTSSPLPHIISVLHSQDLLPQVVQVIEGRLGGDGVNQHKALPILHVQVSHCSELFLQREREEEEGTVGRAHRKCG